MKIVWLVVGIGISHKFYIAWPVGGPSYLLHFVGSRNSYDLTNFTYFHFWKLIFLCNFLSTNEF